MLTISGMEDLRLGLVPTSASTIANARTRPTPSALKSVISIGTFLLLSNRGYEQRLTILLNLTREHDFETLIDFGTIANYDAAFACV
jgi:hypothetical protein